MATLCGLAPSYQRDLQETKAQVIAIVEDALATLDAFARTLQGVAFVSERMEQCALEGYTIATDVADALIAAGTSARAAHAMVGAAVARAERERRALVERDLASLADQAGTGEIRAPLDARASVVAKRTRGSTAPEDVREQIVSLEAELASLPEATA